MVIQRNFRKYKEHRDWPWFAIIQKTRPMIGMVNVEEELRILEEKANAAYGAYQEQLNTKAKLEEENVSMLEEIAKVRAKITEEQGDLSVYEEKLAKASAQKADLEVQLSENQEKLAQTERIKSMAGDEKKIAEREIGNIKQDFAEMNARVEKASQEKAKLDGILRGLNDDVLHKEDNINKLNKEKKYLGEHMAKSSEELNNNQVIWLRYSHGTLESTYHI